MRSLSVFTAVVLQLCLYLGYTHAANEGEACLLVRDCRSAWGLSQSELRSRICGYENGRYPKIWCTVACTTPDSEDGVCTPAESCEPFATFFRKSDPKDLETRNYLRKFVCNSISTLRQHYICCQNKPLKGVYNKPTSTTPSWEKPNQLLDHQCGIGADSYKVVGGTVANLGEHPWAALLQYQTGSVKSYNCGGTLISRRYVLTAGHCISEKSEGKPVNVVLGEHNTSSPIDCFASSCAPKPKSYRIEKIIQHPGWLRTRPQFYDDIALLRLAEDVEFSQYIQPICLPPPKYVPTYSTKLTVAGWGRADNAQASEVKRVGAMYLQDSTRCLNTIWLPLKQSQLCVGGGTTDSCKGDSGGPLMMSIDTKTGQTVWYLVGVVSLGYDKPCGTVDKPGIYTSVAHNLQWIKDNMLN